MNKIVEAKVARMEKALNRWARSRGISDEFNLFVSVAGDPVQIALRQHWVEFFNENRLLTWMPMHLANRVMSAVKDLEDFWGSKQTPLFTFNSKDMAGFLYCFPDADDLLKIPRIGRGSAQGMVFAIRDAGLTIHDRHNLMGDLR